MLISSYTEDWRIGADKVGQKYTIEQENEMTTLLFSKEMAISLRAIFDLAFAVSMLTLRRILVLIANVPLRHSPMLRKANRVAPRRIGKRDLLAAIDAENVI